MATCGPYRTLDLESKVLKEVDQGGTAKQDIAQKYGIKPNLLTNFIKCEQVNSTMLVLGPSLTPSVLKNVLS